LSLGDIDIDIDFKYSDLCYENSRTYLMVFLLIWGSIWWIEK